MSHLNIYKRLKEDHDKHRKLMDKIEETSGDSKERNQLFEKLKDDLTAHANAEEQVFYSKLLKDQDTQEQARHSIAEHKEADDMFEELSELDMSSSVWLKKFRELRHDLEHHMKEEEEDVFEMARKVINQEEAQSMTDKFDDRKSEEL